uniref:type II toxin-antitoxin system RelE/ParE family toxin n=1 Tax=uncultured Sphingomonas sp. TaxID=158754 RepID=UPI0025D49A53|nr:type II toxin-antitoxin system RelE/ParE family toxin [uncultured Sphingomonas sp.]
MKLVWSVRARSDIEQLSSYYRRIDPGLSARMRNRLEAAPLLLLDFPGLAPRSVHRGCRKLRVRGTPYLLYCCVKGDQVIVARVIHSARDIW